MLLSGKSRLPCHVAVEPLGDALVQRHRAKMLDWAPGIDAMVGVFDRDHILDAVVADLVSADRMLRDGGTLAGHDFGAQYYDVLLAVRHVAIARGVAELHLASDAFFWMGGAGRSAPGARNSTRKGRGAPTP